MTYVTGVLGKLGDWTFGKDFLRSKFLTRTRLPRPIVLNQLEERQLAAIKLKRQWEVAPPHMRAALVKQAKKFLTGRESVEDEAARITSKVGEDMLLVLSTAATESAKRDYIKLLDLYSTKKGQVMLIRSAWQDLDARDILKLLKKGKLIWIDPYYPENYQPKVSEQSMMRKLLDEISDTGTVVLIWGRALVLASHWVPIFAPKLGGSKVDWHVEETMFVVVRSRLRDRFTRNFRVSRLLSGKHRIQARKGHYS